MSATLKPGQKSPEKNGLQMSAFVQLNSEDALVAKRTFRFGNNSVLTSIMSAASN